MSKFITEIKDRLKEISEHTVYLMPKDSVLALMSLLRQHLEDTKQKERYRVLKFYADWMLHNSLDGGIVQEILANFSEIITDTSKGHPADGLSEAILLSKLREEINAVLETDAGIQSGIFKEYKNWVSFSELMFPSLLNKPLNRDKKRKPTTEYWVDKMELFDDRGQLAWRILVNPGGSTFSSYVMRTDPEARKDQKMIN